MTHEAQTGPRAGGVRQPVTGLCRPPPRCSREKRQHRSHPRRSRPTKSPTPVSVGLGETDGALRYLTQAHQCSISARLASTVLGRSCGESGARKRCRRPQRERGQHAGLYLSVHSAFLEPLARRRWRRWTRCGQELVHALLQRSCSNTSASPTITRTMPGCVRQTRSSAMMQLACTSHFGRLVGGQVRHVGDLLQPA